MTIGASVGLPRRVRRGLLIGSLPFVAAAGLLCLDRACPPDLVRSRAQALWVLDRNGRTLDGRTAADGAWRLATDPRTVDAGYLRLLLRTEDGRFALHPGVDPLAVLRAALQFCVRGRIVSGGSTLAMQAARLLAPHRHDLGGKIIEAMRALQLEWRYGRRGVLGLYLTLAPEGGNIEGIRAASLLWFGHEPAHLDAREAAFLVALPRRPASLRPDRRPANARLAAIRVLARAGWAVPSDMAAPVRGTVPHVARGLRDRIWAGGLRGVVRTTLDGDLQRAVLAVARASTAPEGGEFAALVVRRDRTIAAWLGGSAAAPYRAGEAIDMVGATRSPGSALKPFVYGLAFGDGVLRPDTLIDDRRMRLGDYAPHDFDRMFHGTVTAADALRQSYNLPAVQALRLVGPRRFVATLRNAGIRLALPRGAVSTLALALGGGGIDLSDLATLYAGLEHEGRIAPLRVLADRPPPAETALLTREAAAEVAGILAGTPPAAGMSPWGGRAIGFKTGTSYGNRDAWAAGISLNWTVVAWAGRPDGTAIAGMTGRDDAAPLMVRLFDLLPPDPPLDVPIAVDRDAAPGLMPSLVRLDAGRSGGPEIVYPPPGAVIESRRDDGSMVPIGLEASGGTRPYRWFVEGAPIRTLPGGEPSWEPDGVGFAHLSVTDADNRAASVDVRLR